MASLEIPCFFGELIPRLKTPRHQKNFMHQNTLVLVCKPVCLGAGTKITQISYLGTSPKPYMATILSEQQFMRKKALKYIQSNLVTTGGQQFHLLYDEIPCNEFYDTKDFYLKCVVNRKKSFVTGKNSLEIEEFNTTDCKKNSLINERKQQSRFFFQLRMFFNLQRIFPNCN
eukprot:TRINITY_DN20118_c3_g1_i1.p2 TRINITY_DN20118_c3_g1~~TRINITY_DN20118_c3_g1_i1.p2  ORF type:complete len:202 (+),score=14.20 TRINITY_DN20118_c3_g1_i1:93-608(+)